MTHQINLNSNGFQLGWSLHKENMLYIGCEDGTIKML